MITKSEVKYIQSLGHKKFRDELKQFIAEGPKVIIELLNSPDIALKSLYVTAAWRQEYSLLQDSLPAGAVIEIKEAELQRISFLSTPHQVLGVFYQPERRDLVPERRISLLLDGVQDPGNMGTLLRIADWFGIENIMASPESADIYNPKVVQSTMGSLGRVNVQYGDLPAFIKAHPGIPVYATTLNGQPLPAAGKIKEGLILIGNESRGISRDLLDAADYHITIPRYGRAESLNAGVAAGIVLSHLIG